MRILNPYRDLGRSENSDSVTKNRSPSPALSSVPEDSPHAKILRLLRVLCQLNTIEAERVAFVGDKRNLSDSAFVNNKLTAKLSRQLEEPMIVARLVLANHQNIYDLLIFSEVLVFRTGLLICPNTSLSCSLSQLVITSFNQLRLDTHG